MKKADKPKKAAKKCMRCGSCNAVYHRLDINLCRRCFREMAPRMGFRKYR